MLYKFDGKQPTVGKESYVSDLANVIGDVVIGANCYIGHGAILRGDYGRIEIGDGTAVEEGVIVHAPPGETSRIGIKVTIGHGALIHGKSIGSLAVIGMGSILSLWSEIGEGTIIAEGSVVKLKQIIPPKVVAAGNPARVVRGIAAKDEEFWSWGKQLYIDLAKKYLAEGMEPIGTTKGEMMSDPVHERRFSGLNFCRAETDEHILTVTIDRPEVLNALHGEAHQELSRVFDEFAADDDLRVAILTASGDRAFCVGSDLTSKAEGGTPLDEIPATGFAGICARFDLNKPVIAAVNGAAIGGGLEIVLACDLVVAADHAVFSLPEPRVGQAALGGGGLQRLVRQIPLKQAMRLILTAERITASQALAMGLINEVVPAGDVRAKARELAEAIVRSAPLSIEASKAVALSSLSTSLKRSILDRHPAAVRMLRSEDAREGPRAFAEKRAPRWLGR